MAIKKEQRDQDNLLRLNGIIAEVRPVCLVLLTHKKIAT